MMMLMRVTMTITMLNMMVDTDETHDLYCGDLPKSTNFMRVVLLVTQSMNKSDEHINDDVDKRGASTCPCISPRASAVPPSWTLDARIYQHLWVGKLVPPSNL